MAQRLSRRSVLMGLGGAALALPALNVMAPRSAYGQAVQIPKRFLVCFAGASIGRSEPGTPGTKDYIVPNTVGTNYDLKLVLQDLATFGVQSDVSIVSNLKIPWAASSTDATPLAGRHFGPHHGTCFGPLLCGRRTENMKFAVRGMTADQIVADAIGASSRVRLMNYRVQVVAPRNAMEATTSFRMANGEPMPIQPKVSPALIHDELFPAGVASTGDAGAGGSSSAALELAKRRRARVLDLVHGDATRLAQRLGAEDRARLEAHMQSVEDLQKRVAALPTAPYVPNGRCQPPGAPGADPTSNVADYSNEELRAELLVDYIQTAFACDISRVGSLMFTTPSSGLNMAPIVGQENTLHNLGHANEPGGPNSQLHYMSLGLKWHVKHFARLVKRLADTSEVDGSRLLDHCALVLVFEGGRGYDSFTGAANSVHSTENMVALIAGGAGGMKQGKHVRSTTPRHPASVTNSAMRAVGVTSGLGEVTEFVPELFS